MYVPDHLLHEKLEALLKDLNGTSLFVSENLFLNCFDGYSSDMGAQAAVRNSVKNLLQLFLIQLASLYPNDEFEAYDPAKKEILGRFRSFFRKREILDYLFNLSADDTEAPLLAIKGLPEAPQFFPGYMTLLHEMILKLAQCVTESDEMTWKLLYEQQGNYLSILNQTYDETLDSATLANIIRGNCNLRLARLSAFEKRRIAWGEELEEYFQAERSQGRSEKMATICSRRKFRANHPVVYDPDTPLPGLTSNSLRSYHAAFLKSESDR